MDIFGPQLQGYQTANPLASMAAVQKIGENQVDLQQKQQEMQQQNALRNIMSQPGMVENGRITTQGFNALAPVAPALTGKLYAQQALADQHRTEAMVHQMQAGLHQMKMSEDGAKALLDANSGMSNAYKYWVGKFNGNTEEAKDYMTSQVVPDVGKKLSTSGYFPPDVAEKFLSSGRYDPDKVDGAVIALTGYQDQMKQKQEDDKYLGRLSTHPVDDKLITFETKRENGKIVEAPVYTAANPAVIRAQTAQDVANRPASSDAATKGWKMGTDNAGDTYRVNENAGLVQKKVGNGWEDVDQLPVGFTHMGSSIGIRNNTRNNLVQAGASNALDRLAEIRKNFGEGPRVSPFFASHPESVAARGVEAVAKQAMLSDKQRNTDSAVAAMLDESIPVFTGGLRSSDSFRKWLVTQVPNMGDNETTAKEKWRLLEANIKGTQKTFFNQFMSDPKYKAAGETGEPVMPGAPSTQKDSTKSDKKVIKWSELPD